MAISLADVRHIAKLARLSLTEGEIERYGSQLNSIITYVEQLNNLDTASVEPTSHVLPLGNVFREDLPRPSLPREEALRNAPDATGKFYRVPRIIE